MKRSFIAALAGSALVLSACSGLRATSDVTDSKPLAFPTTATTPSSPTAVEQVVQKVLPAVVNVVTNLGEGTGFVVRSDGIVVTNYHVVEGASTVKVLSSDSDPKTYQARVIGGDVEADLAVLQLQGVHGLATVPLGSSSDLELGQQVVAIGYALGLQGGPSVTAGIVSSLTRHITVSDPNCLQCQNRGQRTYSEVIQTDAAINPGNSGGPLVDLSGNVVGINTAGTQSAENVGFAIKIDAAKPIIFQAAEHPESPVAYMGIVATDASDPQFRFQFNPTAGQGAGIIQAIQGGPAADAGIRAGDVVVSFDGKAITNGDQLGTAIRAHAPGDTVDVVVQHPSGQRETVSVTLGTNPVPTA